MRGACVAARVVLIARSRTVNARCWSGSRSDRTERTRTCGERGGASTSEELKTDWPGSSSVREDADFGSQESENGSEEVLRDGSHPSSMCTDGQDSGTLRFMTSDFLLRV